MEKRIIKTEKIGAYKLMLFTETDNINPREEYDNPTRIICFHQRYILGDKHDLSKSDYLSWEDLMNALKKNFNIHTIKPLYLYDHSGLTISTKPFGDMWDSMQVGFIFMTMEFVKENGISEDKVDAIIEADVNSYDKYLTGEGHELFGYQIHKVGVCNLGHEHSSLVNSVSGYWGEEECYDDAVAEIEGMTK